jgi:hypothetical protein
MLRRARLLSLAIAGLLVAGCGGSSSESGGTANQFATLDDIVAFYNENTANGTAVLPRPLVDRIHAETPIQERLVGVLRGMLPTFDLVVAVRERFGAELMESGGPSTETNSPVTLTSVEDARAEGTTIDAEGNEDTVHFVRIGDEWWISGYTLEYSMLAGMPEGMSPDEMVDTAGSMMGSMGEAAAGVKRRLDAGEFSTIEEVRNAFGLAMMQNAGGFTPPGG